MWPLSGSASRRSDCSWRRWPPSRRRAGARPGCRVSEWGGLWQAEHFYLYQLVRSVPLLDLPATVGWQEPAYAAAHMSPGLLLAFQLIVIAPLLRIAVEGYRLIVERGSQRAAVDWFGWNSLQREFESSRTRREERRRFTGSFAAVVVFGSFIIKCVVVGGLWYVVYVQVYTGGSWVERHWLELLQPLYAESPQLQPWLRLVPSVVVMIVSWWVFKLLLATLDGTNPDTRWRIATPIAQTLAAVFGVMLFLSGALLLLLDIGVPGPAVSRHPVEDAMATLSWHLVAALPGPDIAATLHWAPPLALAGSPWGWFAVVPKILLLGSVIVIWLPGFKIGTFRQRYAPVLAFWSATMEARPPFILSRTEDINASYQILTRRPEFAELLPAAEEVRAAVAGDSPEQFTLAADRFLAAVQAHAPDCASALRTMVPD